MLQVEVRYVGTLATTEIVEGLLELEKGTIREAVSQHVKCETSWTTITPTKIDPAHSDGNIALVFVLYNMPPIEIREILGNFFSLGKKVNKKNAQQQILENIADDILLIGDSIDGFAELPFAVIYNDQEIFAHRNMENNDLLYQKIYDIGWIDTYDPDIILWFRDVHRALAHSNTHQPDSLIAKEILHKFYNFCERRGVYIPIPSQQLDQNSDVKTIICHALYEIQRDGCMSEDTFRLVDHRYNTYRDINLKKHNNQS